MKITNRNGRLDASGRHNDRNFDLKLAPHINPNLEKDNKYYIYDGNYELSFLSSERAFYKNNFSQRINEQNAKNAKSGHKERNKTIDSYMKDKRTRPEDKILQIGNLAEHATGEALWECTLEYIKKFNSLYGDHCKILNAALHMDEAVPHVHLRRVWIAEDEKGNKYVSENEALKQMGYNEPDNEKRVSKHNNNKMTFTKVDNQLFEDICIAKGFDIEHGIEKDQQHLSVLEYKEKKLLEKIPELEKRHDELQSYIDNNKELEGAVKETIQLADDYTEQIRSDPFLFNRYAEELYEIESKKSAERLKTVIEIYQKELKSLYEHNYNIAKAEAQNRENREIKRMTNFLDKKGLLDEYKESYKQVERG